MIAARVLNVANLYPEWFAQVLDGSKTKEFRQRSARDPVLEAVSKGELLLFRETGGTDRAVVCTVTSRRRRARKSGVLYTIELTDAVATVVRGRDLQPLRLRQGWHRVDEHAWQFVDVQWPHHPPVRVLQLPWPR